MSPSAQMTAILDALSAGHIDAREAARRIDALKHGAPGMDVPEHARTGQADRDPVGHDPVDHKVDDDGPGAGEADAWAAATDRPQQAVYTTERFADVDAHIPRRESSSAAHPEPAPSPEPDTATAPESPQHRSSIRTGGVERISVRAVGRRVRIVAEPSVATVAADGPHLLRRNGPVLEISSEGELGSSIDGFTLLKPPRNLDDVRSLGLGKELFLRVNPDIVVDVEVTAGSLRTEGMGHLGKVRVTAGGAKLLDVSGIDDLLVQAGQATIKGLITSGRSRVRVESGSLNIQLADDSNVTVKGETQMGKVTWTGSHSGAGDEVVMGNGNARLDVEVLMGHALVKVGDAETAAD